MNQKIYLKPTDPSSQMVQIEEYNREIINRILQSFLWFGSLTDNGWVCKKKTESWNTRKCIENFQKHSHVGLLGDFSETARSVSKIVSF